MSEQAQENGAVVVAHDVTRRYGEGDTAVDALRGVTVEIAPGKATAVMGPSGSGKSTLMHILAGLDKPTSGSVGIAGTEITTLGDNDLTKLRREHIGFVFQFFNLLPMLNAKENILLPLTIAGEKHETGWFDQVVSDVGLGDRLTHRPAELLGRPAAAGRDRTGAHLEADRPLRGRADGNLDSQTGAEILELLRRSVDEYGQTIVMVTHDARAASRAHRTCCSSPTSEIVREVGEVRPAPDPGGHGRGRRGAWSKLLSAVSRGASFARFPAGVAIVLGVAMISGTYVLTDTIDRAFKNLFSESAREPTQSSPDAASMSPSTAKRPGPARRRVRARGRARFEVALATGSILDEQTTKILTPEGDAVSAEGAPTFGFGIDTSPQFAQFNPLNVLEGRWPASDDEVVIDASTADKQGYAVGDTVQISTLQPKRPLSSSPSTGTWTASGTRPSSSSPSRQPRSCSIERASTTRSRPPRRRGPPRTTSCRRSRAGTCRRRHRS